MDYPNRRRIKLWGWARIVEAGAALHERLTEPEYGAPLERAVLFTIEAWDVNCPQHITPRHTEDEVADRVEPLRRRVAALEAEVAELRSKRSGGGLRLAASWVSDSRKLMQIRALPATGV